MKSADIHNGFDTKDLMRLGLGDAICVLPVVARAPFRPRLEACLIVHDTVVRNRADLWAAIHEVVPLAEWDREL